MRAHWVIDPACVSLVRRYASRLSLGVELTGARGPSGQSSPAALQEQFGGKYQQQRLSVDFGVVFGQLGESPRVGLQVALDRLLAEGALGRAMYGWLSKPSLAGRRDAGLKSKRRGSRAGQPLLGSVIAKRCDRSGCAPDIVRVCGARRS